MYGIVISAPIQAAIGHAIARKEFAAAFRVREWWPILRANLGGFILNFALIVGLTMALSVLYQVLYVTVVLCCLIPVVMSVTTFYNSIVSLTLCARAYRTGMQKLADSGQER